MTTPIGSGRNACYGYENDDERPLESGEDTSCVAENTTLACRSPEDERPTKYDVPAKPGDPLPPAGCDLAPDYVTVTGSVGVGIGATVSITEDRYHHWYTAGGGTVGTPGLSGSIMAGYLRESGDVCQPPTEEQLTQFLSGGASSGVWGGGGALGVVNSSGMTAHEFGVGSPQLGFSYAVGGRHQDWE